MMTVGQHKMDGEPDEDHKARHLVFSKMEKLVCEMQNAQTGVPLRSQKVFLTTIPCAFTGMDLVVWLLKRLHITENPEAVRLANFLCHYGYFFPTTEKASCTVKEDSSLYRFQAPYYWPAHNVNPDNINYAIHLVKRSLRNKVKHGLDEHEQESLKKLQKMLCDKWDFIHMQAVEQVRLAKTRKKGDKIILDCQERCYWRTHRPAPGHVNCLDECPKRNFKPSQMWARRRKNIELCKHQVEYYKRAISRPRLQPTKAVESYLTRYSSYLEHDPLLTPAVPSNPWIADDTHYWELNCDTSTHPSESRVKLWALDFNELLKDPIGRSEFETFLQKEYSQENIRFWRACEEIKYCRTSRVSKQVDKIYKEFLASGAPCEINIDSETMEKVNATLHIGHRYMFELPQNHIYNLMKKDSYTRFIRSPQYKQLLSSATSIPFGKKKLFNFGSSRKKSSPSVRRRRNSVSSDTNPILCNSPNVTGQHSYSTGNLRELHDKARAFSDKSSSKAVVLKGSPQRRTLEVPKIYQGGGSNDDSKISHNDLQNDKLVINVPTSVVAPWET